MLSGTEIPPRGEVCRERRGELGLVAAHREPELDAGVDTPGDGAHFPHRLCRPERLGKIGIGVGLQRGTHGID